MSAIDASSSSLRNANLYHAGASRPREVCERERRVSGERRDRRENEERTHLAAVKERLEVVQHLAQLVEPDRLVLGDVGLLLDLVKHAQKDLVDEPAERRVQRRRRHDRLREESGVASVGEPCRRERGRERNAPSTQGRGAGGCA